MKCADCGYEGVPPGAHFCPGCEAPLPRPPVIDFSAYVSDRTRHFTGREWVFEAIDDWLGDRHGARVFLVSGEPGCGKTGIASRLVQFSQGTVDPPEGCTHLVPGFLSAYHFCSARDALWTDPFTFAESLALQLSRYPAFAAELVAQAEQRDALDRRALQVIHQRVGKVVDQGKVIGAVNFIDEVTVSRESARDAFVRAVRRPLEALARERPPQQVVILVDALDEALGREREAGIVSLLAESEALAANVRLLLTTRTEERVEGQFAGSDGLILSARTHRDRNQADLHDYVTHRFDADEGLADEVAALEADARRAAIEGITGKAGDNFRYARFFLDAVASGRRALAELQDLPEGLDGLYFYSLDRLVKLGGKEWDTAYAPLMGVLSVARAGLSLEQLMAFSGQPEEAAWANLGDLQQFLEDVTPEDAAEEEIFYRLYHQSVVDFFRRRFWKERGKRHPNHYYLPAGTWHARITDSYWRLHPSRWQECDAYGLDALAAHLHEAGQGARLEALICQEWMAARFRASGYVYDGFVGDLKLAWRQAHEAALGQIEAGEPPSALAACVRFALIRSSLNSLAANYDPPLVARIVETGLWPVERALSVAGRVPSPEGRVRMLVALLATGQVGPERRTGTEEAALAAALTMPNDAAQGWALARLAPELAGEALERGLKAALALGDEQGRVWALAALAPRLTGEARATAASQLTSDALARGLEAALTVGDNGVIRELLTALAPALTSEMLEWGVQKALAIDDEGSRVWALAAMAPHLSGEALARGLEAVPALKSAGSQAWVLAALAPRLRGEARIEVLVQGLEAALAIEDKREQAVMLAALAIGDEGSRAWALAGLTAEARKQVLARALQATLAIEEAWARVEVLEALAPCLTGEALARGLKTAQVIGDEEARVEVLASLAAELAGEARSSTLTRGLDTARRVQDEGRRTFALEALAPQLAGESLAYGLEVALTIEDEGWRARALKALAPKLTGEMLERGLQAALALQSAENRVEVLVVLARQLSDEARLQVLARTLARARAAGGEQVEAEALAALAGESTGEAQIQPPAQGLEAALAIEGDWDRAWALAKLAPQLTGEARRQALSQGLDAARAVEDGWLRAWPMAALARQLGEEEQSRVAAQVLETVLAMDEVPRARALAGLASLWTGRALLQALDATMAIRDEEWQAHALAGLAPELAGEGLARGLKAARSIREETARLKALAAFLPVAPDRPAVLHDVRRTMAEHLDNLSAAERKELLRFCTDRTLFAPPVLDPSTLATIAGNVVEVCEEWRWM